MTTATAADIIQSVLIQRDYDFYGIRVLNDYFGSADMAVGDVLEPSYRWEDGEPTDDELYGTCALAVDENSSIDELIATLQKIYGCLGGKKVLIGGHQAEWGDDDGEIVIRDAVVLAIF